jgi:hypothetical protein
MRKLSKKSLMVLKFVEKEKHVFPTGLGLKNG